jgi:uncharacterized membrane protein YgcG
VQHHLRSIADIAKASSALAASTSRDAAAFRRIYQITAGTAACRLPAALSDKYGLDGPDNAQRVVTVTNRVTRDQAHYNPSRSSKPQTFKSRVAAADLDTTNGGANCDFCNYTSFTATDVWGRVELPLAVTASNLFKYAEPAHGVVLLRGRHDPLAFELQHTADLLDASWLWFERSAEAATAADDGAGAGFEGGGNGDGGGGALYPFLLWNCLPRGVCVWCRAPVCHFLPSFHTLTKPFCRLHLSLTYPLYPTTLCTIIVQRAPRSFTRTRRSP